MTPEEFISRLDKVKKTASGWQACCPAHDDRNPSLSVAKGDDGRILTKCHAGCTVAEIVAAMGLQSSDLSSAENPQPQNGSTSKKAAAPKKRGKLHETLKDAIKAAAYGLQRTHKRTYEYVESWAYHDLAGEIVAHVVRFEVPEKGAESKEYRPIHREGGGWRLGDPPGGFPLYNAPQLRSAKPEEPVFLVEGEKAADALSGVGLLATTSAHGADAARKTDFSLLSGRKAYLLPDNDPVNEFGVSAGKRYMDDVSRFLSKLEPPAQDFLLELPGLPVKGDAYDFVQERTRKGKSKEEIREEILELAAKAPRYKQTEACNPPSVSAPLPKVFLPDGAINRNNAVAAGFNCHRAA